MSRVLLVVVNPFATPGTAQSRAKVLDKLMHGLGFGDGYVAQGGDIGSFVTRVFAVTSPACKAAHINLCIGVAPENDEEAKQLSEKDRKAVGRAADFAKLGAAYASEHGTRPATIGLVLSASPISLLAWYEIPLHRFAADGSSGSPHYWYGKTARK